MNQLRNTILILGLIYVGASGCAHKVSLHSGKNILTRIGRIYQTEHQVVTYKYLIYPGGRGYPSEDVEGVQLLETLSGDNSVRYITNAYACYDNDIEMELEKFPKGTVFKITFDNSEDVLFFRKKEDSVGPSETARRILRCENWYETTVTGAKTPK
jgi:hypothetical protein